MESTKGYRREEGWVEKDRREQKGNRKEGMGWMSGRKGGEQMRETYLQG